MKNPPLHGINKLKYWLLNILFNTGTLKKLHPIGCNQTKTLKKTLYVFLFAFIGIVQQGLCQTQNFDGSGANALSSSKWSANNAASCTFGSIAFGAGNTAVFCTVNGTCTGGSITVGGINATENLTLSTPSGTISNVGNNVITITVSNGKTADFSTQAFSGAAAAGYIKAGAGVLALGGNTFSGGFTLNAGTVIARGVNAMGGGGLNTLTINGGTIAANANRSFAATKYAGGIVVGGNFTLGATTGLALSTADLTFANDMSLGNSTSRTITIGGTGTYTLNGIISGNNSTLTVASTAAGTLALGGVNTYSGLTTVSGGTLSLITAGALPATNNVIVSGGTFKVSADQTLNNLTLSGGTLVIDPGVTLTINGTLSYTSGTLTDNGILVIDGTMDANANQVTGTGALTVDGTFRTSRTQGFSGSASTAVINTITISGSATAIVDYKSASSQTITSGTYATLINSGNGARTFSPTGTIVIAIGFTPGTGLYTVTGSTVSFTVNANIAAFPIPSPLVSGGPVYNNLIVAPGLGFTYSMPSSMIISGDFTENGAGTFRMTAGAAVTLTVNNFTLNSGTFTGNSGSGVGATVNIGGDYTQSGGILNFNNSNGATNGVAAMNVTGDFILSGGDAGFGNGATSGATTVIVSGDYNHSATGTLELVNGSAGSVTMTVGGTTTISTTGAAGINLEATNNASAIGIFQANGNVSFAGTSTALVNYGGTGTGAQTAGNEFRIKGNFSKSGTGTFASTNTNAAGATGFVFNGTGTLVSPQTLSYAGTNSTVGSYYVNSGTVVQLLTNLVMGSGTGPFARFTVVGTLDCGLNVISGGVVNGNANNTGVFLAIGSTLITKNTGGVLGSITDAAFPTNTGANYVFNNTVSAQNSAFKNNPQQMTNLTISNPLGVTLTGSATITGTLAFTAGKITTGANTIVLNNGALVTGAGAGTYVNGNVLWVYPTTGSYTNDFPIGSSSVYAPVAITVNSIGGSGQIFISGFTTTGSEPNENSPIANSSGIDQTKKSGNYWTFAKAGTGTFSTYDISFNITNTANTGSPTNYIIRKFNSPSTWSATTLDNSSNATFRKAAGLTVTFGEYEVGEANPDPTVSAPSPSSQAICDGGSASFTVTGSGSPAVNYQWRKGVTNLTDGGASNISGSNTATLTIGTVQAGDAGTDYNCVVSNINNPSVVSANAALTVNTPSIAPTGISGITTLCSGDPTTLTATGSALGTGANYQWGTGATPGVNPLSGETASTLNVSPTGNTTYWVWIENTTAPCTGTTSGVTQLVTVNQASVAPTGISGITTLCSGDPTILTAMGGTLGTGANYQWGTGGIPGVNPLSGETASTLNVTPTGNTTYWVWIENTTAPCAGTTSGVTQLITVNTLSTAPTSVTSNDPDNEICGGSSVLLTSNGGVLGSSPGTSYKWYEGGCGIGSALGSASTLNVVSPATGLHTYYVRIEDICGNTTCASISILVTSGPPGIVSGGFTAPAEACSGTTSLISVTPVTGSNIHYSWNTGSNSSAVLFSTTNGPPWSPGPFNTLTNQVWVQYGVIGAGQSGYYVCVQGVNACASTINRCIWIRGTVNGPGPITPANGVVACPSTSQTYSCGLSSGATVYTWTLNGLQAPITPNGGNNPTNVSVAFPSGFTTGQLCVTAALACGATSPPRCITINKNPANPTTLTGVSAACPGATGVSYSIPAVPGASGYNWTVPANATIASGANSPSITVNFPASFLGTHSVCVTATSACGTSTAKCKTVTSGIPNQPAGITGPLNNICGSTVQYSVVAPPGGLTYTWTNPAGTTISGLATGSTILLNVSPSFTNGFLTVAANSALCPPATSAVRTSSTIWGRPNNAGTITQNPPGPFCPGAGLNFSVVNQVPGPVPAYQWTSSNGAITAGQGSNAIDVTWGTGAPGTITVKASNSCGISAGTSSQTFTPVTCREEGINASSSTAFSVYPNPAHDKVTVSIDVKDQTQFNVTLLDMSGRIILSEEHEVASGLNVYEMDLKLLAKGIYTIKVQSAQYSWKEKVVVE